MKTTKRQKNAIPSVNPAEPSGPIVTPPSQSHTLPSATADLAPLPAAIPRPDARRRNRQRSVSFSDVSDSLRLTVERQSSEDARVDLEGGRISSSHRVRRGPVHDFKIDDGWNEISVRMGHSEFETHIRVGEAQDIVIAQDNNAPAVTIDLTDYGRVIANLIVFPKFVHEGAAPPTRAGRYELQPMTDGRGFFVVNQEGEMLVMFYLKGK